MYLYMFMYFILWQHSCLIWISMIHAEGKGFELNIVWSEFQMDNLSHSSCINTSISVADLWNHFHRKLAAALYLITAFSFNLCCLFYTFVRNSGCVSEHMKESKPFGDVSEKLTGQIKRLFVPTHTFEQASIRRTSLIDSFNSTILFLHFALVYRERVSCVRIIATVRVKYQRI